MCVYVRLNSSHRGLEHVEKMVDYVCDMDKTEDYLCHAKGTSVKTAYDDFIFIKELYRKLDKRKYHHWVLSFNERDIDIDLADKISNEIADLIYDKYNVQVIEALHLNTDRKHAHFLLNSVRFDNGRKFSESSRDMYRFKTEINEILERYNIDPIQIYKTYNEDEYDDGEAIDKDNLQKVTDDKKVTKKNNTDEENIGNESEEEAYDKVIQHKNVDYHDIAQKSNICIRENNTLNYTQETVENKDYVDNVIRDNPYYFEDGKLKCNAIRFFTPGENQHKKAISFFDSKGPRRNGIYFFEGTDKTI